MDGPCKSRWRTIENHDLVLLSIAKHKEANKALVKKNREAKRAEFVKGQALPPDRAETPPSDDGRDEETAASGVLTRSAQKRYGERKQAAAAATAATTTKSADKTKGGKSGKSAKSGEEKPQTGKKTVKRAREQDENDDENLMKSAPLGVPASPSEHDENPLKDNGKENKKGVSGGGKSGRKAAKMRRLVF